MTTSITRAPEQVSLAEVTHLLAELRREKHAMDEAQLETYTAGSQVERAGFARLYSAQSRRMDDDLDTLTRRVAELGGRP